MKRGVFLAIVAAGLLAGAVLAWNAVRQEREYRRLLAAGDQALARDQTYAAIEAFSGAAALKPDAMAAYLKRGDSYRRRGEYEAALRDLRRAAELDPTAPRVAELLGDVNVAMTRYQRGAEHYRRFLTLDDRAPRVLYKLAAAQYHLGQTQAAMKAAQRALALDDRLAEAHTLLGMTLRDSGQNREALRALERAVAINPALPAAREELAYTLGMLGRSREQIEQLEAIAALEPARVDRLVSVALAYAAAGRTEAAVGALGRAVERHPQDAAVYTALGRVWLGVAEATDDRAALAKAREALQRITERETATSEALALYGRALYLSGNAAAAEPLLRAAISRTPIYPPALLYFADVSEGLRRPEDARTARTQYQVLSGDGL